VTFQDAIVRFCVTARRSPRAVIDRFQATSLTLLGDREFVGDLSRFLSDTQLVLQVLGSSLVSV
jgi:hypothetical protein